MPRLGETMDEAVIVQWLVAEGARYGRGDAILEIETDKTVAEVPALHEGRLLRILAQSGQRIAVGQPTAEVEGPVEEGPTEAAPGRDMAAPALNPPLSQPRLLPCRLSRPGPSSCGRGPRDASCPAGWRGSRASRWKACRAPAGAAGSSARTLSALMLSGRPGAFGCPCPLASKSKASAVGCTCGDSRFAGDRTVWAATASALQRAGHRTAVFDLPGHGGKTMPRHPTLLLTEAALAVAFTCRPAGAGRSLHGRGGRGGAGSAAGRQDPGGLVLLTPVGCGPEIGADFTHGMAGATTTGEVGHLLRLLGPKGGAISDAALAQMAAELARGG